MPLAFVPHNCHMQEDKFAKKALQLLGTAAQDGTLTELTSSLTAAPDRNKGKFLFDLVRLCPQGIQHGVCIMGLPAGMST